MRFVNRAGAWAQFSNLGFEHVQRLAQTYGGPPLTAATRHLTAAEAGQLADALERTLPDVPDHDATAAKRIPSACPEFMAWDLDWNALSSVEYFAGEDKSALRECIAVCRGGAVAVE